MESLSVAICSLFSLMIFGEGWLTEVLLGGSELVSRGVSVMLAVSISLWSKTPPDISAPASLVSFKDCSPGRSLPESTTGISSDTNWLSGVERVMTSSLSF